MDYTFSVQDSCDYPRNHARIMPISENDADADAGATVWFPCLYGESKRIKRTTSAVEFTDSICSDGDFNAGTIIPRANSTSCLSGGPRLQFRDHIKTYYNQTYLAAAESESDAALMDIRVDEEEGNGNGMKLLHQLISCAEAVACRDKSHASFLLSELRANALVFGTSFQRVASCFVQGLSDRLALVQPLGTVGYAAPKVTLSDVSLEKREEALRLVYETCPYIQFGHFVANLSILEAFEGESSLHVVDLGMSLGLPHGYQWHGLIDRLAKRPRPPSRLRITGVGLSIDKFRSIGDELRDYARGVGLDLEFTVVERNLDSLEPKDVVVYPGEVLVVNSILQLHSVVKESRGTLNSVLRIVHKLEPKVLVLVEQDASHNGPFFLGRFMEALHYYSAIFDSLDATLPRYDTKRAKIEQFYLAEEIKNIVSCEGPARVERHERIDQWRRRMSRAGFQPSPLKVLAQAKQWLSGIKACEGYTIVEEKGCLVLGWKSKPIVAASCWK